MSDSYTHANPIPCAIMRGGTSKGIYFLLKDLPSDDSERNALILSLVGGDARQINGLGGGDMLNAKVAVVSPAAKDDSVDIEYRFAQVVPGEDRVDTAPTCGNILSGVGAFAIETKLVAANDGETRVLVRDVNTGARVEQVVQTPGGRVQYHGSCEIAGVRGSAAPIRLYYLDFVGNKCGALFPTGNKTDVVEDIPVSCIDAAMPTIFAAAEILGVVGNEPPATLQANEALMQKIESVRLAAAKKMGMGDVADKVIPKIALISKPSDSNGGSGGSISSRYFTPKTAHAAYAVSGGIALATICMTNGTVADSIATRPAADSNGEYPIDIQHPSGTMRITLNIEQRNGEQHPTKAGVLRTTRLIMQGETYPLD